MTRDLRRLADTEFDVLVVGAGIYGAAIAWEAANRGLRVALIDRGDLGGATSFNSLKTVHGGLRSLQRAHLPEMREFICERRALLRIAPHLVEPLQFVIPSYPRLGRSRAMLRLALALNDFIARDRNDGLDPTRRIEASRVMDRDEVLRLFPGLSSSAITGGAAWYDAQMYNADRVLLAFVQSSVAAGGIAANYVGARRFLWKNGRIDGVAAQDELTGSTFDVRARVTINAAGGWAPELTASILDRRLLAGLQMSKAVNIVTRLPAPVCALGDAVEGQFLFCVPWRGIAMFGTLHLPHTGNADDVQVREQEVVDFLRLVNRAFPAAGVQLESITLVHRGLLPALPSTGGSQVRLLKHSYIRDHRADGVAGLITVVGVRYTTARGTAQLAVTQAAGILGRTVRPSQTATTPLVGGTIGDVVRFLKTASQASHSVSAPTLERLARSYGTAYPSVLALMENDHSLARPLGAACAVTRGEVLHSVREEMAVRLTDALLRRTEAGSAGFPGVDAVESAAAVMASELHWDPQRTAVEIDLVRRQYQTANQSGASSQVT